MSDLLPLIEHGPRFRMMRKILEAMNIDSLTDVSAFRHDNLVPAGGIVAGALHAQTHNVVDVAHTYGDVDLFVRNMAGVTSLLKAALAVSPITVLTISGTSETDVSSVLASVSCYDGLGEDAPSVEFVRSDSMGGYYATDMTTSLERTSDPLKVHDQFDADIVKCCIKGSTGDLVADAGCRQAHEDGVATFHMKEANAFRSGVPLARRYVRMLKYASRGYTVRSDLLVPFVIPPRVFDTVKKEGIVYTNPMRYLCCLPVGFGRMTPSEVRRLWEWIYPDGRWYLETKENVWTAEFILFVRKMFRVQLQSGGVIRKLRTRAILRHEVHIRNDAQSWSVGKLPERRMGKCHSVDVFTIDRGASWHYLTAITPDVHDINQLLSIPGHGHQMIDTLRSFVSGISPIPIQPTPPSITLEEVHAIAKDMHASDLERGYVGAWEFKEEERVPRVSLRSVLSVRVAPRDLPPDAVAAFRAIWQHPSAGLFQRCVRAFGMDPNHHPDLKHGRLALTGGCALYGVSSALQETFPKLASVVEAGFGDVDLIGLKRPADTLLATKAMLESKVCVATIRLPNERNDEPEVIATSFYSAHGKMDIFVGVYGDEKHDEDMIMEMVNKFDVSVCRMAIHGASPDTDAVFRVKMDDATLRGIKGGIGIVHLRPHHEEEFGPDDGKWPEDKHAREHLVRAASSILRTLKYASRGFKFDVSFPPGTVMHATLERVHTEKVLPKLDGLLVPLPEGIAEMDAEAVRAWWREVDGCADDFGLNGVGVLKLRSVIGVLWGASSGVLGRLKARCLTRRVIDPRTIDVFTANKGHTWNILKRASPEPIIADRLTASTIDVSRCRDLRMLSYRAKKLDEADMDALVSSLGALGTESVDDLLERLSI